MGGCSVGVNQKLVISGEAIKILNDPSSQSRMIIHSGQRAISRPISFGPKTLRALNMGIQN
jgi:hypothetical protein